MKISEAIEKIKELQGFVRINKNLTEAEYVFTMKCLAAVLTLLEKPVCKTCGGREEKAVIVNNHFTNYEDLTIRYPHIPCPDCKDKTEVGKPEHDPTCECLNGKGVVFPCTCDYAERLKLFCEQQSEQLKQQAEEIERIKMAEKRLTEATADFVIAVCKNEATNRLFNVPKGLNYEL